MSKKRYRVPRSEARRRHHPQIPQLFEQHVSRLGGVSGGLGRGGHTRDLWGKVKVEPALSPGACWIWRGYLDKDGYGKLTTHDQRSVRAHRWIWEHEHGAISDGFRLISLCGAHSCVNPGHHRLGTQAEAIRLHRAAGRYVEHGDTRGEMGGRAQVRNADVLFMRSQKRVYGLVPVLARLFGVKRQLVAFILRRRTWRHLGNGNKQNAMPLGQLRALADQRAQERFDLDHEAESRGAA